MGHPSTHIQEGITSIDESFCLQALIITGHPEKIFTNSTKRASKKNDHSSQKSIHFLSQFYFRSKMVNGYYELWTHTTFPQEKSLCCNC